MIKIRYAELPAGLHVRTVAKGRSTIIYVLPGLSPAERRAALLRARRGADLGYGPPLPARGLAGAVVRDRIRHTLRNSALAFRAHPLLLVPPLIIVASATLVYFMMSGTLTIRSPQAGGPYPQPGAVIGARPGGQTWLLPGAPGGRVGALAGPTDPPGGHSGHGAQGGRHHRRPSPPPGSSPLPSPSLSPSPSPSPPPTSEPPGSSPSPSPTSSPTPSPSPSRSCHHHWPPGICHKP